MSKFVVYVEVEPYLKQWLTHSFGDPVEFPVNSNENAVLRRFITKRPINNQPEKPGERDVAICIPYSKAKNPETYNFLNGHAKQALTESINDLFRLNMWCDLGDLNDMSCKKMSAFRSWCVQQGIDIEYAETIRMKWYRMRKAYQEEGINLFNLKRCKKDDFS